MGLTLAWLRPWKPHADTIVYNQDKLTDMLALQIIGRRLERADAKVPRRNRSKQHHRRIAHAPVRRCKVLNRTGKRRTEVPTHR